MNLTDDQRSAVRRWIDEGRKLAEIQNQLGKDFGIRLTYMEVRLLVDDLKLVPKDAERPKATPLANVPPADAPAPNVPDSAQAPAQSGVSLEVDQIARAGALVSGDVTFSDGKKAKWYLDQMGRLGMVPPEKGYRPPESDLVEFQAALDRELARLGY